MIYLLDTNILVRLANPRDPQYQLVRSRLKQRREAGDQFHITPQNIVEFWNVATRPGARNGLGLTSRTTERVVGVFERLFPQLPDVPRIYAEWRQIVV
jgi:predicted nucleic acid-binding protein